MSASLAPTFGEEIRRLRGDRSAVDVAAAAGLSQAFLSRLETGQRTEIGLRSAYRLFRVLGVDAIHFAPYFVRDDMPTAADVVAEIQAKKITVARSAKKPAARKKPTA